MFVGVINYDKTYDLNEIIQQKNQHIFVQIDG